MLSPEDKIVQRIMAEHHRKLEDALMQVALAGGGKVVLPHPNPKLRIIKVLTGQDESTLPPNRVEHKVPGNFVFRG